MSGTTAGQVDIASAGLEHPLLAGQLDRKPLSALEGKPAGGCNVEEHQMLTACGAGPRLAR